MISYYGEVPVFAAIGISWVFTKYPSLYLYGALMHAYLHAVGEEVTAWGRRSMTEDMIKSSTTTICGAKASGSRLTRSRVRSFG